MNKREKIERILKSDPDITVKKLAEEVPCNIRYAYAVRRSWFTGIPVNNQNHNYRLTHPEERNKDRRKNYQQTQLNAQNSKKQWSFTHRGLLLSFSGTDRELSALIGRSVQAIQIKRSRLPCQKK